MRKQRHRKKLKIIRLNIHVTVAKELPVGKGREVGSGALTVLVSERERSELGGLRRTIKFVMKKDKEG